MISRVSRKLEISRKLEVVAIGHMREHIWQILRAILGGGHAPSQGAGSGRLFSPVWGERTSVAWFWFPGPQTPRCCPAAPRQESGAVLFVISVHAFAHSPCVTVVWFAFAQGKTAGAGTE